MRTRTCILCICVIVVCAWASSFAAQMEGYRVPGSFDAAARDAQQRILASWLEAGAVAEGLASPITVSLSAAEAAEINGDGTQAEYKLRVGVVKTVGQLVDMEAVQVGAVRKSADGITWSGALRSPGATAIRVHFSDLGLSAGAELYIYNSFGEAYGPYTDRGPTGNGEFWSETVTGDTALIQLRGAQADDYFRIADVGHLGSGFVHAALQRQDAAAKSFCSFNENCIENVNCVNESSAVNDAKDAVAHYQFVQRPYIYICSGGLIANEAGLPYFLTANHCVSRDRYAETVETYFFFTSACGQCDAPSTAHTYGATIAATNKTGDYTILQLSEPAPAGAAFMGWSDTPIAFDNGAKLFRISHPGGAPQAYSEHSVSTSAGTCSSWPRGSWVYSKDTLGATEGGSSGSPVVNADGNVVGQLSGGCGTNVYVSCDSESNATVDGAFASYYPEVASILGGGGSSCDDVDGDGYTDASCGGSDCNDSDYYVNPGVAEFCGDNIDNNCDGEIDEGCGGGECLPQGDACTTGSECCSGLCHPRKLTCK